MMEKQPMRYALAATLAACLIAWTAASAQDQTKFMLTEQEQQLVELVNQERKKLKLPPLKVNPVLCQVARAHAANMARQGKMEHNLDGKTPYDRIKAAGYKYAVAGENLARGNLPLPDVVKAWIESRVHRENIEDGDFSETGIGLAKGDTDKVYYAQVFAQPAE
jgi:uncharacterized protein YkwD